MSGLHEECGVFGVICPEKARDAAAITYYGLYALQHRGQESCGIVVNDCGLFQHYKDVGLVGDVFTHSVLEGLGRGNMAVGHVRYGTTGGSGRVNAQPIVVNHRKGRMALAHNGNLVNSQELREKLEMEGSIFHTTSDTEVISYIITRERLRSASIEEAVSRAMDSIQGAPCRPGPLRLSSPLLRPQRGRRLCGSVGKLRPGRSGGRLHPGPGTGGNPGIRRENGAVHPGSLRQKGKTHLHLLAETCPVKADVVVGVPDSGIDAALGYAEASGIPYGVGFVKNRYIARTFIAPGQSSREDKVKIKLNPVGDTVRGKSVVMIDDSIVRGTTCARIVGLLREAGAREIHVRISAPPFLNPCYYGTDIDSQDSLIACGRTEEEIAKLIGADSLGYLPLNRLHDLIGTAPGCGYCSACFDGAYPTAVPENTRKNRFEYKIGCAPAGTE